MSVPAPSLRILHAEAATGLGGQERRILKEMTAMRERGHHVELLCQPQARMAARAAELGFTVHQLRMGGMANLIRGLPRIRRLLKEGRFDVLNTHSRIDTLLAGLGARLARTPLVVRTRHLSNRVNSMLAYTWVPHRISTVSNHVRDYLIERGVPPARVETIYSPIKLPPADLQSGLRAELGLSDEDIVICSVAVLRASKGHRELIEALRPLMRADARLHLVIVGSGSPMFETLQTLIGELGLQARIHMLGFRDDVPNIMAGSDIFALPTRKEASGTVFVEAAACGLPVVGLDVGGVSEMLRDGETGMLVPPDDIKALRAALRRLIDEPQLRRSMGRAGECLVRREDRFSLRRLAEHTEAVYRRWLREVAPARFR
ncbi:glycosyltransferase family 4 protein [Bordetella pseudohinzii]|uniref:GDP-mannose-dependent alpha-(1-6)-phosphatidylinositol monomannoside mannosyltransferase n=1 Tax=Bordetella pseudohinzii TaxID=1331258 RepID=A0A0J6EVE1_9BORD|nr:glycosyltransferase family 4 protein [Bordetella pseudohinzii]ANY17304.1 glycosyl transferase [Bordetella pseudohinzii]KMM24420.1 glycosyl transferase [Bordetella pseudohinzii]KXA80443.1 glycosyl transferase [Bordetella pseudohinzii]KXA80762.1 glycosyl transferase [Bordetella pseudohinzii]CUI68575.1 GDP-mannose-dependent alpha-(1-6)-phosphatidylinositol monomannoside mannosyltransferase [Bordetella pseudohinzii]